MEHVFITNIQIEKVRHLQDIPIVLSEKQAKHLIFTGKNGSGKTSVIEAMSKYLYAVVNTDQYEKAEKLYNYSLNKLKTIQGYGNKRLEAELGVKKYLQELEEARSGISINFNCPQEELHYRFEKGEFIVAYYKAERSFKADIPKQIEKVQLKDRYMLTEAPRQMFVKYMLDLKVTEALARNKGNYQKADEIASWFAKFQELLRKIFSDDTLELLFDEDTYEFHIKEKGRELFDFNELSSGFAAILDIVLDIIVRMEKQTNKTFDFRMSGIVLIDEIETHLHLDMQKSVLDLLTTIFPNIQFIVSTHSPFILNSLENAVIYDLEKDICVENGLANIPYSGIVEGYFNADMLSDVLKEKFERYKLLVRKPDLDDDDFEQIAELEVYLNEIPDYLALGITTEYQQLKLEFAGREDI